ncbi:hypothetical protein GOODEAATRI_016162 [Goodea atripinnis]|uniref:Uncharacterized protein n=1 Tax=Goodea atripinnis TaxID=208336 RepID=A0ABV0NUY8_9TELE
MPPRPSKTGEKAESEATITKADLIASLAELRSELISELKTSFKEVNDKLDRIQETVNSHDQHLTSLEENGESFHHCLEKVEDSHKRLHAENEKIRARLTELEGRGRRSNIRLIGIPEGIEGPQPILFFLNYCDMCLVMTLFRRHRKQGARGREARKGGDLKYQNVLFSIYEDYPLT